MVEATLMQGDVIGLVQWLVNQGAAVAIALLVLWRLDQRLSKMDDTQAKLTQALEAVLDYLSARDGRTPSIPPR